MTIPHVPSGGNLESAAQNALIDQSNAATNAITAHDARLDALETAPPDALDDLADVTITSPTTGQAVIRSANGWVNGAPAPATHTHAQGDVTGLATALSGKANTSHTHAQADVTGLGTALAGKADTTAVDTLDGRIDALETADPPTLGELADVDTTGATTGQVLKLSAAGTWAPGTDNTGGGEGGGATTLDELTDVSTTGAADGNVLGYSGGLWSPTTPSPAAHTHAIADVTGLQSALDGKATTASVTSLTGRVSTLESAAANLIPTTASDTLLYGDVISSHQRSDCQWGESLGNGYMTAAATRSPKTFTATELRLCVTSAATGAGTFDVKLYTGTSLAALTERVFRFGDTHMTTTGVRHIDIGSLAITEGQYIAVCMIVTGWTGSPRLSSTPTGTGAQLLIGEQPYSVYQAGQTFPPPASLNMTEAKWTRANQLFWFALS